MSELSPKSEIQASGFYGREGKPIVEVRLLSEAGVIGRVYGGRYEGEQGDTVAIKQARPRQNSDELIRFEARLLRDLEAAGSTHTPIVHSFHDTPETATPYFVMDLAPGTSLTYNEVYKKEGRGISAFTERTALEITYQLAQSLSIAERVGYAYADWKEGSNVFWDPEKHHATLIDWNAARVAGGTLKEEIQRRLEQANRERNYELARHLENKIEESQGTLSIENLEVIINHFYLFLTGDHLKTGKRPEDNPAWHFITPGTQAVFRKGFHPDSAQRYQNMEELEQDLKQELERWQRPTASLLDAHEGNAVRLMTAVPSDLPELMGEACADLGILHRRRSELSSEETARLDRVREVFLTIMTKMTNTTIPDMGSEGTPASKDMGLRENKAGETIEPLKPPQFTLEFSSESLPGTSHEYQDERFIDTVGGVAAVFDGVTGADPSSSHGKEAAVAARIFLAQASQLTAPQDPQAMESGIRDILIEASKYVLATEGSTTAVVARFFPQDDQVTAVIGWVGDSRAYVFRAKDGRLEKLTEDHDPIWRDLRNRKFSREQRDRMREILTTVGHYVLSTRENPRPPDPQAEREFTDKLVKEGIITENDRSYIESCGFAPRINMVSQYLGWEECSADVLTVNLSEGDKMILVTDGVYKAFAPQELEIFIGRTPTNLAKALVEMAKRQLGSDDMTAAVVEVKKKI